MTADPTHPDHPDHPDFVYDEFGYFHENAQEYGLEWPVEVEVRRVEHSLSDGRVMRGLRWRDASPRVVFLHGGAQNAHTWDTVVLALGQVPSLAVDLPGHGRSDRRDDGRYDPRSNAEAIAEVVEAVAPEADLVVGMSLGGLTATALAAARPHRVARRRVVDGTPGVNRDKAKDVVDFIAGPQTFPSFEEIFARTVEFNPTRSHASLRRGILHNAHRLPDGSWEWNYDRRQLEGVELPRSADLWEDVSVTRCSYLLVRGADSPVVDDEDEAELRRRRPDARVVTVEGAGHSIQGDRPLELAELIAAELE